MADPSLFLPVLPEGEPIDQFLQTPVDYFSMDSEYYPLFTDFATDLPPASIPYTKAVTAVPPLAMPPMQHNIPTDIAKPVVQVANSHNNYNHHHNAVVHPNAMTSANGKKRKPEVTVVPPATMPIANGIAPTQPKNSSKSARTAKTATNKKATATKKAAAAAAAAARYRDEDEGEVDDGEYCEDGDNDQADQLPSSGKPVSDKERQRQQRLLKNRKAAQQFRRRQKSHIIELEGQVDSLSGENKTLKSQVQMLSTENKLIREQLEYMRSFVITVLQVNCSQGGGQAPTIHDFNAGMPRLPSGMSTEFGENGNSDETSSDGDRT